MPIEKISWGAKQDEKVKAKELEQVQATRKEVHALLTCSIDWYDGSVLFTGQLLHLSNLFYSEFLAGRLGYTCAAERLGLLKQ